jgi:predicted nuclease of predicted toxin-antitoxin system
VILTLDLDFGTLLALTHSNRPSVIQIRREDVDPINLRSVLIEVLREYSDAMNGGALMVIDEKKIRLRKLPL